MELENRIFTKGTGIEYGYNVIFDEKQQTEKIEKMEGNQLICSYSKRWIEENKADMVSLAMLDVLTQNGMYTNEEKEQIIVTYATDNMLKSKPTLSQAHRVRSVMQNYYFLKEGALEISKDGILTVNIDKVIPTAQKMLKEIIRIQIDGDFNKGEEYVLQNFVWTPEMELIAEKIKKVSKSLNGKVEEPLAKKLLSL